MHKTVYLAGPITGLTFDECTDWRQHAVRRLASQGIKGLTPLRGKEYLNSFGKLSGHGREYADAGVLSTARAVMTRDRFDATRCDVLLVNLLGAKIISVGTVMEMAWADLRRTPIVCAIEKTGNIHEHMMIDQAIGFRLESLDEALSVVESILL